MNSKKFYLEVLNTMRDVIYAIDDEEIRDKDNRLVSLFDDHLMSACDQLFAIYGLQKWESSETKKEES